MVGPTLDKDNTGDVGAVNVATPGAEAHNQKNMSKEALWAQKERNCFARLGETRPFEIVDGRFDASGAIPGRIVYRRWGTPSRKDVRADGTSIPPILRKMEVANRKSIYFRIEDAPIDIFIYKNYYFLKSKKTNTWYYLLNIDAMYGGKSELGGFN